MCHQTVSLVARQLEADGISTVVLGSARDIVEEVGVPRFVFTDFPLGNPVGPPYDEATQASTARLAIELAESAIAPRTTVQFDAAWPNHDWRTSYMIPASPTEVGPPTS